jgi:hypothetical protein
MAGRKLSAYRRDDDDRPERAMSFFALVRFIALDASTAGKDPAFLEWFTAAIQ